MSKAKLESVTFLRKQLMMLHCYVISAGTRSVVKSFKTNPSYDFQYDPALRRQVKALHEYCNFVWQDPAVFLNLYLPLRLHPVTRGVINTIINRYKPKRREIEKLKESEHERRASVEAEMALEDSNIAEEGFEDMYYYGIMLMAHSVVTIFKNNSDIAVTPADINMLHNFCQTNLKERTVDECNFWREMCLPGMTEDFRLPVYFTFYNAPDEVSQLKIVYVCEEQNEAIAEKLTKISTKIFDDLQTDKLIAFLIKSEGIMFNEVGR